MKQEHESDLTISYTKIGDYYFPNIALPPDAGDIGIWGRRRKEFLQKHRPILFNELLLTGELSKYLVQVNQEAIERLE
ncbi:MAG: TnpV protein, partial [Clostridia bacterium]|nr:TnpV protein [Clostridia bacterium]